MERLEAVEAKAAEWAAEREELRRALEAKDELLKGEASKNASLAVDLEKAQAEIGS